MCLAKLSVSNLSCHWLLLYGENILSITHIKGFGILFWDRLNVSKTHNSHMAKTTNLKQTGRLDSVEWNGGLEWWNGLVEWTGTEWWNGLEWWTGMEWWNGTVLW